MIAAGADTNTIGKSISEGCQRSRGQVRREVQVDAAGMLTKIMNLCVCSSLSWSGIGFRRTSLFSLVARLLSN